MNFLELLIPIFVNAVLPIGGTLLTGLVSWGLIELNKKVRAKTKNEIVSAAMTRITHTVETTVKDLEQTLVPEIKKVLKDGKLTAEEGKKLKATAIATVKAQLPVEVKKAAYSAVNSLTDMIGAKINGAVFDLAKKL